MKIQLPSYLKKGSGRIEDIVLYSSCGKMYARKYVVPVNPDTEKQRMVRRVFGDAIRSWQSLSPADKYLYNRKAFRLNLKGYNLFIAIYMKKNLHGSADAEVTPSLSLYSAAGRVTIRSSSVDEALSHVSALVTPCIAGTGSLRDG